MPQGENPEVVAEQQATEVSSLPENTSSGESPAKDPLDEITDTDALRGEAKKFRAIATRKSQPKETPKEAVAAVEQPTAPADVLTMKDLHRINTQRAIEQLKQTDPEFADHVEEIKAEYVNKSGLESPESIVKDLQRAKTVWKALKPAEQVDPAAELQKSQVIRPSSKPAAGATPQPLWGNSGKMKDWYPRKS